MKKLIFYFSVIFRNIEMTQIKPQVVKIEKESYYLAEDLKIYSPEFFAGTSKGIRKIIERKNIPISDIAFASEVRNVWKVCTEANKKAKLFLTKNWTEKFFFNKKTTKPAEIITPEIITPEIITPEIITPEPIEEITTDSLEEVIEENVEIAPDILDLEDEEKFKDLSGNIIEIETRGKRNRKNIFFKVKDIMDGFQLQSLNNTLLDNRNGYIQNIHYQTLSIRKKLVNNKSFTIKKALYLTYKGLLRVLFVSRNKNAEHFQDWAEEKLFTIQMGTEEKKEELGTEILNLNIKSYRAVLKNHASKFPCIYLLELGTTKNLRQQFNISNEISDDSIVYKYGFTDDIERRLYEHGSTYGKMKNVNINLATYHIIDLKYVSEAEDDLRQFFKNFKKTITTDGHKELVVLDSMELRSVKREYKMIGIDYAGATQGLQNQIEELKEKITMLHNEIKEINYQHEIEIMKKDMTIQQQQAEIEKKELIIQIRDLQLEKFNHK